MLQQLTADADITADALLEVMEKADIYSEIVTRGLEAAISSSSESKRRLLGRVIAAAITGDGIATPQVGLLLVKAVDAIEPPHVQLLVFLARPTPGEGELAGTANEGRWTENDIRLGVPEFRPVLRPLLAVLEREGLTESSPLNTSDGAPENFAPSPFGRSLLTFLDPDELNKVDLGAAAITCRYFRSPIRESLSGTLAQASLRPLPSAYRCLAVQ